MLGHKRGDAVYEEMMAKFSEYKVVVKPTGSANQSIIGSAESVENRFSTMREKLAAEMRLKLAKMNANK